MLDARSVLRGSNRRLSTDFGQLKLTTADADVKWRAFGRFVAIDGNTIVVGASYDSHSNDVELGSVYVFRTSDGGATYVEVAKLTASDGAAEHYFGTSVAIDGNTVVIGASGDDGASFSEGSAYVFRTSDGGATYVEVAKLTAADAAAAVDFGSSVAIDGDTVVVGTSRDWIYIFRTTDGGAAYGQVAKLDYEYTGASVDGFVAIAGGTVVAGAPNGEAAYVFLTSDGGATYAQVAKLTASDGAADDRFGNSVSIDGDTIVIGANQYDNGGPGAVYVFRTSDGWDTHTEIKLTASDGAAEDAFGYSVAISGDTVVVAALRDDDPWDSGSAYVFNTTDGGATYDQVAKLTAADAGSQDHLGYSVAIAGDVVVVGSSNEAAYIFSPHVATAESAALGSDSATRAGGTFFLALLVATVLAL